LRLEANSQVLRFIELVELLEFIGLLELLESTLVGGWRQIPMCYRVAVLL